MAAEERRGGEVPGACVAVRCGLPLLSPPLDGGESLTRETEKTRPQGRMGGDDVASTVDSLALVAV